MARSLPLETLLHIFSFLKEDLVACASVCREWQVAAEKTTFGHLLANSENLEDLRRIVGHTSTPWRPCFVKKLDFKCILPAYSVKARARYENEDDRRSNDISFTQAITSLFDVLSSWSADYRCEIELVIYARSLSDFESEPDWNKRKIRSQRGIAFPEEDLLQARYRSSYLQLTEKAHISTANCVVGLRLLGIHYRDVSPQSASEIVSRLPRLRTLSADLSDSGGKCLTTRDQLRNGTSSLFFPSFLLLL